VAEDDVVIAGTGGVGGGGAGCVDRDAHLGAGLEVVEETKSRSVLVSARPGFRCWRRCRKAGDAVRAESGQTPEDAGRIVAEM